VGGQRHAPANVPKERSCGWKGSLMHLI